MKFTQEERAFWTDVLKKTNGDRERLFSMRQVPDEYRAHMDNVTRTEHELFFEKAGVPVKVYVTMAKNRRPKCQVHINIHGGGWCMPWTEDDALYCAHIADETKGIVVDIDYSLGTEHSYPVPVEQCYGTACWVAQQCDAWDADPSLISIGGNSAGGHLSTETALLAAKRGGVSFRLMILDVAALDLTPSPVPQVSLPEAAAAWRGCAFSRLFLGERIGDARSAEISPWFASDEELKQLPETMILSAERCPFHDQDEAFARRLASLGVTVTCRRFVNSSHAFIVRMREEWQDAQKMIIRKLQEIAM